jgi:hypothetical protein
MRRVSILLTLLLVVGACGDDDATPLTSTASTAGTESTVATAATTVAPTVTVSTTGLQADDGPTDCLEVWPETVVQAVAGDAFTFFQANADRSACTYFDMPNGIALAWRSGDRADFQLGRSGAGAISGATDIAVCDVGYLIELSEVGVLMEAHSETQRRTYTATMSGMDIDLGRDWAVALFEEVC